MQSSSHIYEEFLSSLPEEVQRAAAICSVPHWLNDTLAYTLVDKFANLDGKPDAIIGYLKSLPIVYPYETRGWRVVPDARLLLQERIIDSKLYKDISKYLTHEFDKTTPQGSPMKREVSWRAAFHTTVVNPEESIERLDELTKWVDETRLAELKAAIDLCKEQSRWLSQYEADVAYFQGRYAYVCRDYQSAQSYLQITWESGSDTRRRAIAGHLLGVMLRKTRKPEQLAEAEELLREALDLFVRLGEEEDYGTAHTCNTLAATLKDRGKDRLSEAVEFARRSLEIGKSINRPKIIGVASVTLASSLLDFNDVGFYDEIRELLQNAVYLGEQYGIPKLVVKARKKEVLLLQRARDYKSAVQCLRNVIEIEPKNVKFHKDLARNLIKLGELYFQEAEKELRLAQQLDPNRSTERQLQRLRDKRDAIALRDAGKVEVASPEGNYDLGKAYEHIGDHDTAIKCFERAISLGDNSSVVRYRLGRLLATDDERREEAVERLMEAVDKGSRDAQILALLARSLHKLGCADEAEPYFNEALKKDKKVRNAQLRNWYGLFLLEAKNDYEGAYSFLRQALDMKPSAPLFANDVGRVILEARWREKFPEARKLFQHAIKLTDDDVKWPRLYLEKLNKLE